MKKLLILFVFLTALVCPNNGLSQATIGFHRVSQVLARNNGSVNAQVVPNATVVVTNTASPSIPATIYSDPLLTSQITPAVVTADSSGNYSYYIPLNYCVTETITSPGQGSKTIPNICGNTAGTGGNVSNQVISTIPLNTNGVSTAINASSGITQTGSGTGQLDTFPGTVAPNAITPTNPVAVPYGGTSANTVTQAVANISSMVDVLSSTISTAGLCSNAADPTGVLDSTCAIQAAFNYSQANSGSPILFPCGKYRVTSTLMWYTIPSTNSLYAPGLKIQQAGPRGCVQILVDPVYWSPASTFTYAGIIVPVASAVIDLQGTLDSANFGLFMEHTDIQGIELTTLGCESNPASWELTTPYQNTCSYPSTVIDGISVEGCWHCDITHNDIHNLSGSGIAFPLRYDIGTDPDWWASAEDNIIQNQILLNEKWGVDMDGSDGSTFIRIENNGIESNYLGGVKDTGWGNRIVDNVIAGNGCAPSTPPVSCTTSPLGPGILVTRSYYPSGAPLLGIIQGNTLDSNAAAEIALNAGSNYRIEKNFFVDHTTEYLSNATFPGAQNVPKVSLLLGGGTGAINATITDNQQRSDYQCAAGYPTPAAGCGYPNYGMDPELTSIEFEGVDQAAAYVNQNLFRDYNNSGNYQPYTVGAGVIAGYPCSSSSPTSCGPTMGGGTSVYSWALLDGGLGLSSAPTLKVWGGDSAFVAPTLVTLTQSGGALNSCTIQQAGGPYSRAPLLSVGDNQNAPGSGGTFTLTLSGGSSGTPTACAIGNVGSGYLHPFGGVAPQCATPPVVTATSSLGIDYITISSGGNYGPWTPGSTAPVVTASVSDATGSGYTVRAVVKPVNKTSVPSDPPSVQWEVVGVTVISRGFNSTAPTVSFSSTAQITAAIATVTLAHLLNPALTVATPGTCDAGATLGLIVQYAGLSSSNANNNLVNESNGGITAPPPSSVSQSTIGNMTFWNPGGGGTMGLLQGKTPNVSTGAAEMYVYHDDDGAGDSAGIALDATGTQMKLYPFATGADSAQDLYVYGATGQSLGLGSNGGVQWTIESTGDLIPNNTNSLPNLGSAAHPAGSSYWSGKVSEYGGNTTVNGGMPAELGTLNQTGVSTANSGTPQNVLASTPAAGTYELVIYIDQSAGCATVGSGALTIAAGWTDPTHARSTGTIATLTPGTAATGTSSYIAAAPIPINAAASSAITVTATYTACSSGTWTYDLHAVVLAY